jgi:hypothetical protein
MHLEHEEGQLHEWVEGKGTMEQVGREPYSGSIGGVEGADNGGGEDEDDGDEEEATGEGQRSPSLPVKFTFRPFTEEDAHRTLSLAFSCCSVGRGGGNDEGAYNRYAYSPSNTSFSSYPSFSTSTSTSKHKLTPATAAVAAVDSGETVVSSRQHEYQSLDRASDLSPGMSPVCNGDTCCPAVNYCVGQVVGNDIILLEERFVSRDALFGDKLHEFQWKVTLTRLGAYLMLSVAFFLILKPVASVLSFVPYLGALLLNFFWVASLLGGFAVGLVISALAWVLYRPLFLAGIICYAFVNDSWHCIYDDCIVCW